MLIYMSINAKTTDFSTLGNIQPASFWANGIEPSGKQGNLFYHPQSLK
jgi:hypothetical protein